MKNKETKNKKERFHRNHLFLLFISTLITIQPTIGSALYVNTITGALIERTPILGEIDIKYNSRSITRGIFGLSRCTLLDYKVAQVEETHIKIDLCFTFLTFYRTKNAHKMYIANDETSLILVANDKYYLRLPGQLGVIFDSTGKVSEFTISTKKYRVERYPNHWNIISDGSRTQLYFGKNKLVGKILSPSHEMAFSYHINQLKVIQKNKRFYKRYTYDKFDNLTRIQNSKGHYTLVSYSNSNDRVMKVVTPICQLNLSYTRTDLSTAQNHSSLTCLDGKALNKTTHISLNARNQARQISFRFASKSKDIQKQRTIQLDNASRVLSSRVIRTKTSDSEQIKLLNTQAEEG